MPALFYYYAYRLYWFFRLLMPVRSLPGKDHGFSIGITTFLFREKIFKILLKRLVYCFPGTEVIIAVNGHYNLSAQAEYTARLKKYCSKFKHVKLISFNEPCGLSKLWNQIILNASSPGIFLFNDDILFTDIISDKIVKSGILNEQVALIDNSFSHFFINRGIINVTGWFDERFAEIGGEDDDFHVRLDLLNIELKRHNLNIFRNYKPVQKVNSYGHKISEQESGYSTFNSEYLLKKWEISDKEFDGAHKIVKSQGTYWKLRKGMETPDFYKLP